MGLISKIEDKLSGSSSNSNSNSNKLEKPGYDSSTSGTTSKLQHPISSSTTTGTSSSQPPSSYPQNTSGYTSTTTDRMPGSYVTDESHIPPTNTSSTSRGPTQPYDPYSSKGQETAARAGTTDYGTSQTQNFSRTTEDPSIARSKEGGIMNQPTDQRYTAPQTSSTAPTSDSHYGRDAAIAGGAGVVGAGGVGAYEMGKNQPSSQPLTTSSQPQDVSYMNQTQPTAQDPAMAGGATSTGSGMPTESAGLTQARKMGGAYEAGYRDAMEHMRAEMAQRGSGTAF